MMNVVSFSSNASQASFYSKRISDGGKRQPLGFGSSYHNILDDDFVHPLAMIDEPEVSEGFVARGVLSSLAVLGGEFMMSLMTGSSFFEKLGVNRAQVAGSVYLLGGMLDVLMVSSKQMVAKYKRRARSAKNVKN